LSRRLLVAAVAAMCALAPRPVLAHAQPTGNYPAAGALLSSPPAEVTVSFSETVSPAGRGIHVYAPSGIEVGGQALPKGMQLIAPVEASEPGTYVVSWQVLAADTHPSRGAFSFSVIKASGNRYLGLLSGAELGTTTPLGLALQTLGRWLHFAGYALAFGGAAYLALIRRERRLWRLVLVGVGLLLAAEPVGLLAQLVSLSLDTDTAFSVLASGFGRLLALRIGGALLLWSLLAVESPWPILGLGAVVALIDGTTGHAVSGQPVLGQALDAIHVAAMSLWAGGLVAFLLAPDRRFGRLAAPAAGIAVATGLLLAYFHDALPLVRFLPNNYGWAMALKMTAVAGAAAVAALGRRRLEAYLLAAVLLAAALVVSLPSAQ